MIPFLVTENPVRRRLTFLQPLLFTVGPQLLENRLQVDGQVNRSEVMTLRGFDPAMGNGTLHIEHAVRRSQSRGLDGLTKPPHEIASPGLLFPNSGHGFLITSAHVDWVAL